MVYILEFGIYHFMQFSHINNLLLRIFGFDVECFANVIFQWNVINVEHTADIYKQHHDFVAVMLLRLRLLLSCISISIVVCVVFAVKPYIPFALLTIIKKNTQKNHHTECILMLNIRCNAAYAITNLQFTNDDHNKQQMQNRLWTSFNWFHFSFIRVYNKPVLLKLWLFFLFFVVLLLFLVLWMHWTIYFASQHLIWSHFVAML